MIMGDVMGCAQVLHACACTTTHLHCVPVGFKCKDVWRVLLKSVDIFKHHVHAKVIQCTFITVADDVFCPGGAWNVEGDKQQADLQHKACNCDWAGQEEEAGDEPQYVEEQPAGPKANGTC